MGGELGAAAGAADAMVLEGIVHWKAAVDAFTAFMLAAGLRARTIELRRYQLRRLAEANLRRTPCKVRTADLVEWLAAQDWSPETRRSYRAAISAFYGWMVSSGCCKRSPAAQLPKVRQLPTVPRPTPEPIVVVGLASASDRDRLILALAAYAGLRRAEIAGLEWADITGGVIRVRGKGGRVRTVPVHPELAAELAAERDRRDDGGAGTGYRYTAGLGGPWIFPGQSGGPMTPNAVGKAATAALAAGWGAHSLRHRFATRTLAASGNLLVVQTLLGHASPNTTIRYTQLVDDSLAAAVNSI